MNTDIYSVSDLNAAVADLLESEFAWVTVEGEISTINRPASGHLYFTLKDDSAKVECVMFRGSARNLTFEPETGVQVQIRAKVSMYQPWGKYQLTVDRMEAAGAGQLQQRFEALKRKLAAEGLFEESEKYEVPQHAQGIAVITSRSGAAVRDVISVIDRRFPATPVHLYPVTVQGEASAPEICRALELAAEDETCDVILLVRGGGSIEDLWSFNEETVARAIFDCPVPVVSGVGHEVDFTIADFVADLRAATPTAAAEAVTSDQQTWFQTLDAYSYRFAQLLDERVAQSGQRLDWLKKRLQQQHPLSRLRRMSDALSQLGHRLTRQMDISLDQQHSRLDQIRTRFLARSPAQQISSQRQSLIMKQQQLIHSMQDRLQHSEASFASIAATLQALSPLKTLARGYSITTDEAGIALTDSRQVAAGQRISSRLSDGRLISLVEKIEPGS